MTNIIIGVTGKIGSGKSTASKYIHEKLSGDNAYFDTCTERVYDNHRLLSCDELVSDLYSLPHVQHQLHKHFLVKNKVGIKGLKLNINDLDKLAEIFLPFIVGYLYGLEGHWVVEIPLLFERKMKYLCYTTINISTYADIRCKRIDERLKDNFGIIDSKQMSDYDRNQYTDHTVNNNGTPEEMYKKLDDIIEGYLNS